MATVNRFFRPTRIAQVNPISFEQLSYLPNLRRQQHNALLQGAVQNSLLSADTMGMDQEVARQVLDPLEQRAEEVSQNLSKNGYSNELGEEFIGIQKDIAKTQRDVTSKLTARKAGLQEKAKQITDFYKDQPQIANALTQQLYGLNTEASTLDENGNIQIPGMKTPFVAQVYTSEDKLDLYNKALEGLKPMLTSQYKIDTSGGWYDIVEQLETKGVSQERIASLMQNALGQDYLDSYKVEASVGGVGMSRIIDPTTNPQDYVKALQRDQNILLGAIDQQKNFILQNHLISKLTAYKKANKGALPDAETINKFKEEIEADKNYKEQTAQYDSRIAQVTNGDLTPEALAQGAIDIYAQQKLNNDILKTSEVYAYSQQTRDISKSNKPDHLFNSRNNGNPSNNDIPSLPGGPFNTENYSPLQNFQEEADNITDDIILKELGITYTEKVNADNYTSTNIYTDKNGKRIPAFKVEKLIQEARNIDRDPKTSPVVQNYIQKDPRLVDYKNKKGVEATVALVDNWYKNAGTTFGKITPLEQATTERYEEIYRKTLQNMDVLTTDGKRMPAADFVENELNIDSIIEAAPSMVLAGTRHLFGNANVFEARFINSKNQPVTAYLPATDEMNQDLTGRDPFSAAIEQTVINIADKKLPYGPVLDKYNQPLPQIETINGKDVPIYYTAVPDFERGEGVLLYGTSSPNHDVGRYLNVPFNQLSNKVIVKTLDQVIATSRERSNNIARGATLQNKSNK